MLDALKPLLDSGVLTEDTRRAISEAWETKLAEAREQVRTEIREEFANRYEHDRKIMVEAIDRMVTEALAEEIREFHQDKKAIAEQRVKTIREMQNKAAQFDKFLAHTLAEEITEFRKDRQQLRESANKLESFVFRALAEEIVEFAQDKRALVETRVKLVDQARKQLTELRQRFVKRSSKAVAETISRQLRQELTQLREDINQAKRNSFGRKIFEAFASEFLNSQLNESVEMRKLTQLLESKNKALALAQRKLTEKNQLVESKQQELETVKRRQQRESVMNELLSPLAKDRQRVMRDLLENVQTAQLRSAYDKYLPAVLNEKTAPSTRKQMVTESHSAVTGDRDARPSDDNVIDIKRLAGL